MERIEPLCRRVIESGEPMLDMEMRGPTQQGRKMVGLMSLHPLKATDGKVRAVSVVVLDITARILSPESPPWVHPYARA